MCSSAVFDPFSLYTYKFWVIKGKEKKADYIFIHQHCCLSLLYYKPRETLQGCLAGTCCKIGPKTINCHLYFGNDRSLQTHIHSLDLYCFNFIWTAFSMGFQLSFYKFIGKRKFFAFSSFLFKLHKW